MSEIALSIRGVPELPPAGRLSSDERLARLVSRGSERAFATLYERHHQALYRYARSIVRDEEDARDALQSAMARAFAALRRSERDVAVRPWLFRIVHNESVSILRRRRPGDRPVGEDEPSSFDVERTAHERERLATLLADLHTLGVRQRAALVMRELSGLSIAEIAVALSTSPGAAKQTLFEARCALQEIAEGRAMACETARRSLSERDGRVLRGRKLRAHLRACTDCRAFQAAIGERSADLRALAPPLPAAAAGTILAHLLAGGAGGHGGAAAAAGVAAAGGTGAGGAGGIGSAGGIGGAGGMSGTGGIGGTAGIGGTGGIGGTVGAGAGLGGHMAGSLAVKALALGAILAAATAGTARFALKGHGRAAGAHGTATAAARPTAGRPADVTVSGGAPASGAHASAGATAVGGGAATNSLQRRAPAAPIGAAGPSSQSAPTLAPFGRAPAGRDHGSLESSGGRTGGGRRSARGNGGERSAGHRSGGAAKGNRDSRRPQGAAPRRSGEGNTPAHPTAGAGVENGRSGAAGQPPRSQPAPSEGAREQGTRERASQAQGKP